MRTPLLLAVAGIVAAAHLPPERVTPTRSIPAPCARPPARKFAAGETIRIAGAQGLCKLELVENGIALRPTADSSVPTPGENVVIDSKGRIYSNASIPRGSIAIWKPDGTFEKVFGRGGTGPDDFRQGAVMLWTDDKDQLHVLAGQRQWWVLSPTQERVARAEAMPIRVDDDHAAVTGNGTVIASIPEEGKWFGVADMKGTLLGNIGDFANAGVDSPRPDDHTRQVVAGGADRFWASPERNSKNGYTIDLFGTNGVRHLSVKRDVDWFPAGNGAILARNDRPGPYVFRINADTSGLVTTFTVIPNAVWDSLNAAPLSQRAEYAARAYSGYIEVIDTRAGVLLASQHFPPPISRGDFLTRFLPGRLMGYRHVKNAAGLTEVRFFDIKLSR